MYVMCCALMCWLIVVLAEYFGCFFHLFSLPLDGKDRIPLVLYHYGKTVASFFGFFAVCSFFDGTREILCRNVAL